MTDVSTLQPMHDRVLVEPLKDPEVTAGGVFLPDNAQEKPQRGRVLAVGPGRRAESGDLVPIPLAVGDVVVYSRYGGTEVRHSFEDGEALMLREADILALEIGEA